MLLRLTTINKLWPISLALHLLVLGVFTVMAPEKTILIPISLGPAGQFVPGNGRPVSAPPAPVKAPVAKPVVKTTTNPVAPKIATPMADAITTTAAATAPAGAVGDGGTGVGSGVIGGTGPGKGTSNDPRAMYGGAISKIIQQNLQYPRSARMLGLRGIVHVSMTIAKDGRVITSKLDKKSPHQAFNQNALDAIKRVGKFPPIPAELGLEEYTFIIPVEYIHQL